jgi:5-methylcytosine-specific restriction protein B
MNLENVADLRFAWEHKVMPLLQEYFYGDGEKLLALLGSEFVTTEKIVLGNDDSAEDRIVYRLRDTKPDEAFVKALKRLAGWAE